MAPSPRAAPPTFEQTWDETDAAFLDPTSLPIAKVPRAWERKRETKLTVQGKQKNVWRRYTTRSRIEDEVLDKDDEEARDSRTRAVKKLQHMSPEAMEKSAAMRHGKKRAFKATRWDRRRSVLPRKKKNTLQLEEGDQETERVVDDEDDADDADVSNTSFSEVDMLGMGDAPSIPTLVPDSHDRRATFTFSVEEDQETVPSHGTVDTSTSVDISTHDTSDIQGERDATLTQLFQSPTKSSPPMIRRPSFEDVGYPELPQPTETDAITETTPQLEEVETVDAPFEENPKDIVVEADNVAQEANEAVEEGLESLLCASKDQHNEEHPEEVEAFIEAAEVPYPSLPAEEALTVSMEAAEHLEPPEDYEMADSAHIPQENDDVGLDAQDDESNESNEGFTEASVQLNIQRDMELEPQTAAIDTSEEQLDETPSLVANSLDTTIDEVSISVEQEAESVETNATVGSPANAVVKNVMDDIAAGLTLGFSIPSSREPTPRKLRSPSPPPVENCADDTTMTMALDDDTAVLKDFLSRAAASKANKSAVIARRESLQNRRDSDVVRYALASPRKILEDKDPNSPSKYDNDATLDLSQTLTLSMDPQAISSPTQEQGLAEGAEDTKTSHTSRRSSRTRKSRLPAPSSIPTGPPKIAVRRADGGEPIVLKKSDSQELALLTRANTRKNKQGFVAVSLRLLKLANEATGRVSEDNTIDSNTSVVQIQGKKYVRWDEQLAYYQEGTDTMSNMVAEAESLASPDELSLQASTSTPSAKPKSKASKDKNSTPKVRRVRGLGTTNGTPGKGLLTPGSLLPDVVQEEKDVAQSQVQRLPKPKPSKLKKMAVASSSTADGASPAPKESKLPALDVAPVGIEPAQDAKAVSKERKSRLATPKRVKLPQPAAVPVDGKENQQRSGIAAATPKKGIPMPMVTVPPSVGVETGLPRRRARKI